MPVNAVSHGPDTASYRVGLGARASRRNLAVMGTAALVGAIVFAALALPPVWRLHFDDASFRSGIETGLTLCAFASALLLVAHYRQTRLLRDLLLLAALATSGLTMFVFNTLPGYGYASGVYGAGAQSALVVLVSGVFLAVAFAPAGRQVDGGRQWGRLLVPAAIAWVALGELIDIALGPVRVHGYWDDFHTVSLVLSLVSFGGLIACAYGFVTRRQDGDVEALLLAAAAYLLAVAQLGRLPLAVVPSSWVTVGDGLRAAVYLLLLVVSIRRYGTSQAQKERDAIRAERRRIARDLHDGLAQDLAFIAAHSDRLAREYGADHPLAVAARRALAASRGQIIDLEASTASDTEGALRQVARELAGRHGVQVTLHVERGHAPHYSAAERRELVRIAREAIVNAIRHGGAQAIAVTLGSQVDDLLLRVSDDGCGFGGATAETAGTGLGLQTMRDRAGKLGGRLTTRRTENGRTEVDVTSARPRARVA